MSFTPFINAPVLIQAHAVFALVAVLAGPAAILRRSRDRLHKSLGYVWVVAMFLLATTAVFIPAHGLSIVGHWGPIHLFVVVTYWSLWVGMRAIYRGDIGTHMRALKGLYWQGLLIAGLFNFLPGRTVNRMLFPDAPQLGWGLIALGGGALALIAWRQWRPGRSAPGPAA